MADKSDKGRRPVDRAARVLDRKVALARAILLFERLWRTMLWPFVVAGLFLLISFAGLWTQLPPAGHGRRRGIVCER